MHRTTTITWIILIGLTISSAVFSMLQYEYFEFIILTLAILKFIGIAFQFMELKKAHVFWKVVICVFLIIFVSTTIFIG